jgi:hypothetical protein
LVIELAPSVKSRCWGIKQIPFLITDGAVLPGFRAARVVQLFPTLEQ